MSKFRIIKLLLLLAIVYGIYRLASRPEGGVGDIVSESIDSMADSIEDASDSLSDAKDSVKDSADNLKDSARGFFR